MQCDEAREVILRCFEKAVAAAEPAQAVERAVGGLGLDTGDGRQVTALAFGKAAPAMARGLERALGRPIDRGVLITKDGHAQGVVPNSIEVFEAAHPVPDGRALTATRRLLEVAESADPDGVTIMLISGGGSALLELPRPGVSLDEIARLTGTLLKRGASIHELNAIRSRLSQVKGGGLLHRIGSVEAVTLVLSDVLGNDLSVIASGPATPLRSSAEDAIEILTRLGLWDDLSDTVRGFMSTGAELEYIEVKAEHRTVIVADNNVAIEAASTCVRSHGRRSSIQWRGKEGEARELAEGWVRLLENAPTDVDAVIGGGEATVTVLGDGLGGRNTEFALAATLELERRGIRDWVVASLATDGDDGPTGAAGGIVDASVPSRCRARGVDPQAALARNDSLRALEAADAAVMTGPTGTNVNDLYVAIRCRPEGT